MGTRPEGPKMSYCITISDFCFISDSKDHGNKAKNREPGRTITRAMLKNIKRKYQEQCGSSDGLVLTTMLVRTRDCLWIFSWYIQHTVAVCQIRCGSFRTPQTWRVPVTPDATMPRIHEPARCKEEEGSTKCQEWFSGCGMPIHHSKS